VSKLLLSVLSVVCLKWRSHNRCARIRCVDTLCQEYTDAGTHNSLNITGSVTVTITIEQRPRNEFENGGHLSGAIVGGHRSEKFVLVVPLHFLALKAQLVVW